jgi:hypothetical protein
MGDTLTMKVHVWMRNFKDYCAHKDVSNLEAAQEKIQALLDEGIAWNNIKITSCLEHGEYQYTIFWRA